MEIINLDMVPGKKSPVCHASQFDEGRVIRFNLYDSGLPFTLDGTESITFEVRKPDGNIVTSTLTNTSDSYVDVVTTEQMTAVKGANLCEVRIEKGETNIGSLNVIMAVEMDPTDGGIASASEIDNLRNQVNEMVAEEVAEQYDSENVIFDSEPTEGHGTGFAVTSEGIKKAIDNAFDYDNTASGSLVHIEDGADNIPVKSLVSEIVAVQNGSGTPSPSNPRAISGFDSGIITRCGKNLFNASTLRAGDYNLTNPTIRVSQDVADRTWVKKGITYTFSFNTGDDFGAVLLVTDENNTIIENLARTYTAKSFTPTNDGYLAIVFLKGRDVPWSTISVADCQARNPMIERGDTATTYEAYNGNTYTFNFGQTVYGGRLDVLSGELTIVKAYTRADSLSWDKNNTSPTQWLYYSRSLQGVARASGDCVCSHCPSLSEPPITVIGANINASRTCYLNFLDAIGTNDLASFNAYITNNNVQLVYELATPIVVQLTPTEVTTLLGENNIFSNTGDVEVEYYTNKAKDILEFVNTEIGKKNGTNIPIEAGSQDSIKTYVDDEISSTKDYVDNGLSGKADRTDLPFVKYQEVDVVLDSAGEGTLFTDNKFVVGIKDIASDSLYVGYAVYYAGTQTKCKAFSRSTLPFTSQSIVSMTRKIGVYYIDNIATQ